MDKKDKLQKSLEKNLPGVKKSEIIIANKDKKDIKDDYELARTTYKDLIQTGMRLARRTRRARARESEHPRAFEVLSRAIKDVGDTTDKLMELQKNKKALNKEEEETEKKRLVTNNNLFVGSTADLQKMILDKDFIDAED